MDDCDHAYLVSTGPWHFHSVGKGGYAAHTGPRPEAKRTYMHKEVAKRKGLLGRVDHKNKNKLDDRRQNLRPATRSQNKANGDLYANNTQGRKGVYKDGTRLKAFIRRGGKGKHLGFYDDTKIGKIQAAFAYDVAALKCFKRHAVLNTVGHLLDADTKKRIKQDVLRRLKDLNNATL